MGKRDKWDPKDYTLEDQLSDILKGWDVSADDTSVIKVKGDSGRAFISADNERGHVRYDLKDGKWEKTH